MNTKIKSIKVLGSGCPSCQKLEQSVKNVLEELNLNSIEIEHVYDIDKIIEYGVMSTPAIVIDDQVKSSGRIPRIEEIKSWFN